MRRIHLIVLAPLLLVGAALGATSPAHYRQAANGMVLPDATVTPGAVRLTSTQTVCTTKWGIDARHVTARMKREVYVRYHAVKQEKVCCEVDHLISRELGGADVLDNLWPQPWPQARQKDRIENWLHRQVCAGKMSLRNAQVAIAKDWTVFLQDLP